MRRRYGQILLGLALLICTSGGDAWSQEARSAEIDKRVDSLFVLASSGEVMHRDLVQPAIDSLAAMGAAAVPRLIEIYDTQDARERQTINNILVKIGKPAVPYLVNSLTLDNAEQVGRICATLGEIRDSAAVEGLIEAAGHADWRVRSEAVGSLGKIADSRGNGAMAYLLLDTVGLVRKSAAVAAGSLLFEPTLKTMVNMLADDFYGARLCALEALVKFGEKAVEVIADSINSERDLIGNLGCLALGHIGGDSAVAVLVGQLDSPDYIRRAMAVEGIFQSGSSFGCGFVELMKERETNLIVQQYIRKVMERHAGR